MLKRVFVAPDPGRLRLRFATRAVIGVAAAVAVSETCGLSLTASIVGGLAALLALFTVTDATVRDQQITTAQPGSSDNGTINLTVHVGAGQATVRHG